MSPSGPHDMLGSLRRSLDGTTGFGPPAPAESPSLSARLGFVEPRLEIDASHPALRRALAATGSTLGFLVTLDDDLIQELAVDVGLGHRGFEKQVEAGPWLAALPYVRRLGPGGAPIAEVAYCLGIEALAGLEVPERATWIRTLVCELARASDHFTRLASVAAALGIPAAEQAAWQGAVATGRLLERTLGGGPGAGFTRPGGVERRPPDDFDPEWTEARRCAERSLARFDSVGRRNPSVRRRLRDVAPLDVDTALAWSVTGPALRAAGLSADLRCDAPVLAYASVDFDVPVGERGDGEDRLSVVVEEVRQSLRIVEQCRDWLGEAGPGPIRSDDPAWDWPAPREDRDASAPGPDALASEEPVVPAGEVEIALESSTGELGFLLVSDGEGTPGRVRCRAPSLFHAQALPEMLRGARLDDLLPTVAGMHIVSAECDR